MKNLWILLVLSAAVVAVTAQSSTTKKSAAPPPKGKSASPKASSGTTQKTQTNRITMPPAKSASGLNTKCMCQDDIGMDQFDLSKYLGTWNLVNMQAMMAFNPYTGNCMKTVLSATSTKNVILADTTSKFSISTLKSNDTMTYLGQGVFSWQLSSMSVITKYSFNNGTKRDSVVTSPINSTLKYVVIDTDYTNYTIVYICGNYSMGTTVSTAVKTAATNTQLPPPHLFMLMSREKKTSSNFDMNSVKNTIKKKYSCYLNMQHPTAQDANTCKGM